MSNPIFRVKCKIDGEVHTIDVQTHGNKSIHPSLPVIKTEQQAYEHVVGMSQAHRIDHGDGNFHYAAHIDAAGEEHTITDIEKEVVRVNGAGTRRHHVVDNGDGTFRLAPLETPA